MEKKKCILNKMIINYEEWWNVGIPYIAVERALTQRNGCHRNRDRVQTYFEKVIRRYSKA